MTLHRALPLAIGAALMWSAPVHAQSAGDGYLFYTPVVTLSLRGGFAHASAGSDLFSFTTENLTVGRADFSGAGGEFDLGIRLTPVVDAVLGTGISGTVVHSEDREYVREDDSPIPQTTTFERVPVTASVKVYLAPRGRSIGQFAWIPSQYAPYVGAGAGGVWYRFRQEGEFVDYQTEDIFGDTLESSGWASAAHVFAGTDVNLSPHWALSAEARYLWSRATLGRDFEGFEPIDLSGLSLTAGVHIRL